MDPSWDMTIDYDSDGSDSVEISTPQSSLTMS